MAIQALILREKDLTEAEYEQLAGQVMKICETYKFHVFFTFLADCGKIKQ